MPLTTTHGVAGIVCVVAAAVMLVGSRDRVVRLAHVVVLAAMAALVFSMHSLPLLLGCAWAMVATTALLLLAPGSAARHCAVDTAVTGALLMVGAMPLLLAATPTGSAAVHAHTGENGPALSVTAVLAAALLAGWAVGRRRLPAAPRGRVAGAAAWVMMLAMGGMVAVG